MYKIRNIILRLFNYFVFLVYNLNDCIIIVSRVIDNSYIPEQNII